MNIDESKQSFELFKIEFEKYKTSDLTESDTRSKLLDHILIQILGWKEDNITREKFVQVGYFDYNISIPGFQFVIEAKKNFNEIQLPTNHKAATLNSLLKGNADVITQLRNYLFEVGVQNGIISNGRQFIIGKFVNDDGTDWKKNKCVVFNGINEIENRFVEFYNLLSFESIIQNGGFCFEQVEEEVGKTIYSSLSDKSGEIVRNSLSSELTPVLDQVFGEIYKYEVLDNEDLIKECFIENKEIKKNKSDIEKLFGDKPPKLSEVSGARNTESLVKQISTELGSQAIGLNDIEAPKPILIIGSKGAGKTTFINYLFKSAMNKAILKDRPFIYLDFRRYVDEDLQVMNDRIFKDIVSSISEEYERLQLNSIKVLKQIYRKDIKEKEEIWKLGNEPDSFEINLKEFLKESTKDFENHFIKISHFFLRERGLRLTIVIDNADQFDLPIQRKVFLFSQSLNRKAKAAIILSLREGYYYEWRDKPPFDAFINNVYHITAPPYGEVLQKRIDYALKKVEIAGKSKGTIGGSVFEVNNQAVKDFLLGLRTSLFGVENSDILTFLEETTYPNLREGLKMFRDFLLSGHTEVSEYILRQQVSPKSTKSIPFWEFLKAIALLNKKYYNSQLSSIHNLFHPAEGNSFIFLKIQILKYLLERIEKYGQTEKFLQTSNLILHFTEKGYKMISILNELNMLLDLKLIDTDDSISDKDFNSELTNHKNLSISLKGRYYVETLITTFEYMEMCLQDTPIYDIESFAKIRESFPMSNENGKRNLSKRYESMIYFLEYLIKREKIETNTDKITFEMKFKGLNEGLKRVERSIEKLKSQ